MARDQHAKDVRTIQELNLEVQRLSDELAEERRRIKSLSTAASIGKPEAPRPLSRSSIEAYVGIAIGIILGVLPMTWWIRIILFAVLAFVCGDFIWRSPVTYRWRKFLKGPLASVVVLYIGWVGWGNVRKAYQESEAPPEGQYMLSYGGLDPNAGVVHSKTPHFVGTPGGKIIVNGYLLGKYADKYQLIATCFQWSGSGDFKDAHDISKSGLFDIAPMEISMTIPWNAQFMDELEHSYGGINYAVLLVPRGLSPETFTSLRAAMDKGAKLLQSAATIPSTMPINPQQVVP